MLETPLQSLLTPFSVSMLTAVCLRGGRLWMVTTPAPPLTGIRWQTLHFSQFHSQWQFFRKKGLVLQNSQRRESFLYKSGSDYDVASPRWRKFYGNLYFEKKYLGQCPEPPLCPQSSDTQRLNLKFICAGNGNMDISGSYCHTFCPNSGQFKDS